MMGTVALGKSAWFFGFKFPSFDLFDFWRRSKVDAEPTRPERYPDGGSDPVARVYFTASDSRAALGRIYFSKDGKRLIFVHMGEASGQPVINKSHYVETPPDILLRKIENKRVLLRDLGEQEEALISEDKIHILRCFYGLKRSEAIISSLQLG